MTTFDIDDDISPAPKVLIVMHTIGAMLEGEAHSVFADGAGGKDFALQQRDRVALAVPLWSTP